MAMTPLRASARGAQADHFGQALGRQMLHHLRAEDAVERHLRAVRQVREQVGDFRVEALMPAGGDGFLAQIDAARGDAGVAHHLQKFAAAAADIEHVAAPAKYGR